MLVPRSLSGLPPTTLVAVHVQVLPFTVPRTVPVLPRLSKNASTYCLVAASYAMISLPMIVSTPCFTSHVCSMKNPPGHHKRIDRADLAGRSIRAGLGLAFEGPLADKRRQLLTSRPAWAALARRR